MMRKLRDMCWEAMALSLVLSMNVSARRWRGSAARSASSRTIRFLPRRHLQ